MTQVRATGSISNDKSDGRLLRSERSRRLIIESMINLVDEGFLVPTAQQVAQRADVGIRSVFRHFDDMDDIFETANEIIFENVKSLFTGGDRTGVLEKRILHATEQLTSGYAVTKNFILSGKIRMWNTPVVRKNYLLNQKRLQKELENWIPEIIHLDPLAQQNAYAVGSFDYWHRLQEIQELQDRDCVLAISQQLKKILC
jgi:AcrR family transcriptional regulator